MQTAMENGDFMRNAHGLPVPLYDWEAKLQEILIRLSVRKGRFPLDLELGSDLYKLTTHTGDPVAFALDAARRALAPMGEITLEDAEVFLDRAGDGAIIRYTLRVEGKTRWLEVKTA